MVAALTEFELIDRYFKRAARSAVLGIGDDAALIVPAPGRELAISVDMLVAGRHFLLDADPQALGHKTLAVNLSDMAAMGAHPRWALLAGALPHADADWLERFADGFHALAEMHGVELIGGDTTRGPLNLCVTILGEVPAGQALRRSGARVGDKVWVSGVLGDAALGVAHQQHRVVLEGEDLARCERALHWPAPRVALGERLRGLATSAIDVSDGLLADLGHVLDASEVGATIALPAVPRSLLVERLLSVPQRELALSCLLAGGDDYELCFTAPPQRDADVAWVGDELGLSVRCIGAITAERGLTLTDEAGRTITNLPRGFDHFAS